MSVSLYHVKVGPLEWRYTSGEFDVITAETTWEAVAITRTDLTFELKKTTVSLTLPHNTPPFDTWKSTIPSIPIEVTIYDYPSMAIKYTGRVSQISYDVEKGTAKAELGSTDVLSNTTAPCRTYGTLCSFELFSNYCGVDKDLFKVIVNTSDITIVSPTAFRHSVFGDTPEGSFRSGFALLDTGESQFVTYHTGDEIQVLGSFGTLDNSSTMEVYYGCNKSQEDCENKFGNLPNFGGFPFIPDANPVTEGF